MLTLPFPQESGAPMVFPERSLPASARGALKGSFTKKLMNLFANGPGARIPNSASAEMLLLSRVLSSPRSNPRHLRSTEGSADISCEAFITAGRSDFS